MLAKVTTPFDLKSDFDHTLEFWVQNKGGVEAYVTTLNLGKTSSLSPETTQCTKVYRNYWLETFANKTLRQRPAV
jgi:hypothetical protein